MLARFACACCLWAYLSTVTLAATEVESSGAWTGKIRDPSLRKLAPESGFVADAETWKKIWLAWRPGEKLPEVDFATELILVATVPGPNLVRLRPTRDETGNVAFVVVGTKIGGPGCCYKLLKIDRLGITSVNGQPIAMQGVQGVLVIPQAIAAFAGHKLPIQLWEYDPLLADAPATLADQCEIENYGHSADRERRQRFPLAHSSDHDMIDVTPLRCSS